MGLIVAVVPANAATIRVPKTAMQACAVSNGIYCVESLTLTDSNGKKIPLVYVPSGADVPMKKTPADFYAPIAKIVNGKVVENNWWMSQYQRDVLASGKMVVLDATSLLGTANFPEQGAKYDPAKKTFDITKPLDTYSYPTDCWGQQKTFADCIKGANVFMLDNEVKFMFYNKSADEAARANKNFITGSYVDLAEISALQQRPVLGTTYDAAAKTFGATEGIIIPIWVSQNALVNGWAVAGTVTTPAPASTDTATAQAAPLAPDTSTIVSQPTEAGRVLPGRWTSPDWQGLNLGALGYDGLYIEAKSANEFTNILMIDVLPTLTGADKKVNLAGQVGNKAYATSLDPDIVISAKVRTGEMKPGVTVAVGVDVIVDGREEGEYTSITVTGTPVTVPLAAKAADCKGEAGVSKANVRQFQAIVLPSNDDMSGFGVDGTSGDMYVGSNGVCELSTPVWSEDTKSFTWTTAAPHFAPDGVTVNRGFYKAIIPTGDAAILWGMTNPNDAATALNVSVTTEAGGSVAAISKISVKNGKIIIDVSGFQFSRPKLKIGIKPGYKPSKATAPKSTITCVQGKSTKKITAVSPVCPKGYKKK